MKIILICLISIAIFSGSALAVSSPYENENKNVDLDLLLEKAYDSYDNLELNDALFYLDEILKQDPDNILALNNKGVALIKLERYDEALLSFEKAIEINPNYTEAINAKALALFNMNRDLDALSTLYDSHKIDPFNLDTIKDMHVITGIHPLVEKLDMITAYAKIEVRNSNNQIVTYTESDLFGFQHPLSLLFLEDNAEWKPLEINGKEFEVLEYSTSYPIQRYYLRYFDIH